MSTNDPTRTSPQEHAEAPSGSATGSQLSGPGTESPATGHATATGLPPAKRLSVSIPGYEVLEELGRGGMGVVFRARDLKLNRTVALKMVLGAEHADPKGLIRFLVEAEAVAAIKHPNVVQIHEFGEGDGHPFMALEFLPGGTLTKRLEATPDPASSSSSSSSAWFREVVATLAKVARGVAAAHALGIVHRDLKPANVLFDEHGEPKVADFGLARRGAGADLTMTHAIMGTPPYMSPEQAMGNNKFVGPEADVWSLGVILYESLTGKRPFTGHDPHSILRNVVNADPVRPRKHRLNVPRDLELICLHCLEKQQHERYPTAKELADDLERFLEGKPISVRSAGPVELAVKWTRRNKVVAGAMAAVALALLVGSAVSFSYALEARREAKRAKDEEDRAEREAAQAKLNANTATHERNDAIAARNDLKAANDELIGTLARSYVGPLNTGKRDLALSPSEVGVFWSLASQRGKPVNARFLEEVTATSLACKQLANRADFVFQAAVGLDHAAADRMEQLIVTRFDHPATTPQQRLDLAFACASLSSASPATAERAARILIEEVAKAADSGRRKELSQALAALLGNIEPPRAVEVVLGGMALTREPNALGALTRQLAGIAPRLEPTRAVAVCTRAAHQLAPEIEKTTPGGSHSDDWVEGLVAATGRMEPREAAGLLAAEIQIPRASDYHTKALAAALSTVAQRLEPEAAAKSLGDAFTRARAASVQAELARGLARVAARMDPTQAAKICGSAASDLIPRLENGARSYELDALAEGIAALAPVLDPAQAAKGLDLAARKLTDEIAKATSTTSVDRLCLALGTVALQMEPHAGVKVIRDVLDRVARREAIGWLTPWKILANGLVAVTAKMKAREAYTTLFAEAFNTKNFWLQQELEQGMAEAVARMDPETVDSLFLWDRPGKSVELARALIVVAARMEPEIAASRLRNAISEVLKPGAVAVLATGIATNATRLPPDKAAAACHFAADRLLKAREGVGRTGEDIEIDSYTRRQIARSLAALAPHMDPGQAQTACETFANSLVARLAKVQEAPEYGGLAVCLAAIAPFLEPTKAAPLCRATAATLVNRLGTESSAYRASSLTAALIELSPWLDPAEVSSSVMESMRMLADLPDHPHLVEPLAAFVASVRPDDVTLSLRAFPLRAGAFALPRNLLAGLPLLHLQPQPRPLPPRALVELLKHPFCVGSARRVVLDALELTYRRSFRDQWDFVRFVREANLPLDLATPPTRGNSTQR